MADKGEETREKILAAAQGLILQRGFAGATLEQILAETKLTKGAFFHHFRSKADLAQAVLERYAQHDVALFKSFSDAADAASEDPYARVVHFLESFERYLDSLGKPFPGCVFAAYTYESSQFGPEMHRAIRTNLQAWLAMYEKKLEALIAARAPREKVSARELAEMIGSIVQGGIMLARAYDDADWLQRQSQQYRTYLKLLFDH